MIEKKISVYALTETIFPSFLGSTYLGFHRDFLRSRAPDLESFNALAWNFTGYSIKIASIMLNNYFVNTLLKKDS